MNKTASIHVRVDPELKQEVEMIFDDLGLSPTDAVTIFYKQVLLHHGIPFEIKLPNKETLKVFRDTEAGRNLTTASSKEALLKTLKKRPS